ncbi:hypothetical protein ECZU29_59600 [Escherichia coli]|nr:hypothetical protein ECZU29_59600 [Escherichia coli]
MLKPAVLERQRKSRGARGEAKNKHSLSHVRHDPAHCLAPACSVPSSGASASAASWT